MDNRPNMPEPVNGMIKSYDSSHRSFTRPYSAKNIVFYKHGDDYFQGVRLPVSKAKYRNLDSLLDDLTGRVPLSFGVRRVFTPTGRTEIRTVDQLQHMGRYICSSSKWAKINYDAIDKLYQLRKQATEDERNHRRTKSHNDTIFASSLSASRQKEHFKSLTTTQTPPILSNIHRPKQVLFVLNGSANRVYRALIQLQRLPMFDELLSEVSQGLQTPIYKLFTFDGKKVVSVEELANGPSRLLACRRHERPEIERFSHKFPPIRPNNNIRMVNGHINTETRREATRETRETATRKFTTDQVEAVTKIQAGVRGYLTRRNIQGEHEAASKIQAGARGFLTRKKVQKGPVLEGCETEKAVFRIQAFFKAYLRWKRHNREAEIKKRILEIDSKVADASALNIQAHYRGFRSRKQFEEVKELRKRLKCLEPERAEAASIVIQSAYRGYKARRNLWHPGPVLLTEYDEVPSPEHDFEKQEKAAVLIQAAYRGRAIRDQLKRQPNASVSTVDETSASEAVSRVDEATASGAVSTVNEGKNESKAKTRKKKEKADDKTGKVTYAVSIFTGNRWGADYDGDLFIEIFGEKQTSGKLWLKQQELDQKFLQNQVDTFDLELPYLGTLEKITVGHDSAGYGAGTFLERVIISDTVVDMKQFIFLCSMWLDSCQVDRKLSRTMYRAGIVSFCTTFPVSNGNYNLTSMPDALAELQELGEANALSSSNKKSERNVIITFTPSNPEQKFTCASRLPQATQNKNSLVEFGAIGDLYKLRFQCDGSGSSPGWFLDFVSLKDMDTAEEFLLYCGKWMCVEHLEKGIIHKLRDTFSQVIGHVRGKSKATQNFREVPVIRVGIEPLGVVEYSLKIELASLRGVNMVGPVKVYLVGEYGDSGSMLLPLPETNGGPPKPAQEVQLTLEAVSLGRLWSTNFLFPVDDQGGSVSQAFMALQEVYEKQNQNISTGSDWMIRRVLVRESLHAPYQFVFGESHVTDTDMPGIIKKQVLLSKMDGLGTRAKDKKGKKKSDGKWTVWVTSGDHGDSACEGTPKLIVFGNRGKTEPLPLHHKNKRMLPGKTYSFHISVKNIGEIFKIRLVLEPGKDGKSSWYLKKLKMKDDKTGDELRFPVEMWLDSESVVEMPAVWPDIPPLPLLLYQVTVVTSTDSGNDNDFIPVVTIYGEKGDSGLRHLRNPIGTQSGSCFKPGNVDTFEIEAVTVKEIKKIEIGLDKNSKNRKWLLDNVKMLDPETNQLYVFECKRWISTENEKSRVHTLSPSLMSDSDEMDI